MGLLYEDRQLRVRHVGPGAPDRLLVTFANWSGSPGLDRPGFAEAFAASRGIDAILVTAASNHWYQLGDMAAAHAAIRDAARAYRLVVTYGASMGGYQALRSAAPIGAHRALAFSPQFSIDPRIAPWETRWPRESASLPFSEAPMSPDGVERLIAFDPGEPLDGRHGALIRDAVRPTELRLPFSGHASMRFLQEAGILSRVVLALLEPRPDLRAIRALIRSSRARSATYFAGIGATARLPARTRAAALRRSCELEPGDWRRLLRLAAVELELADHAAARRWAERAGEIAGDQLQVELLLGKVAMRAGDWTEAINRFSRGLAIAPNSESAARQLEGARRRLERTGSPLDLGGGRGP